MDNLIAIAEQFNPDGKVLGVQEYGTGNVNDTYLATLGSPQSPDYFILQRINQHVFKRPELIMVNMNAISEHVHHRLKMERNGHLEWRRWEIPRIYRTKTGDTFHVDEHQGFWRAISFIGESTAFPHIQDAQHAYQAGYALGRFQSLISDIEISKLHDTLVGFHITPMYLKHYDEVVASVDQASNSPEVDFCRAFVEQRRAIAPVLEDAKISGGLRIRPMHGDPKIDNIMIADSTREAVSIIDLDTVKPGLVQYDIGDCLRSSCNPLGEETTEINQVYFDLKLCEEILRGYLSVAASFFSALDYEYLYVSIQLIAFELGVRFFTDHMEGNVYFKARYREHNLHRALVQFKLVESIEKQERAIRNIISEFQ